LESEIHLGSLLCDKSTKMLLLYNFNGKSCFVIAHLRNYYVIIFAIVLWNSCIIQRARNGTWTFLEDFA